MVSKKTVQLAQLSILAALIVVLQLMSYGIKIGAFNLSLVLIPLVVGGVLFGARSGAVLGFIFGVVVVICCITGMDVGGNILWNVNPWLTALVCLFKGTAAGFTGGAVAQILRKENKPFLGVLAAAIVVPIVNTGWFVLGMWFLFRDTLTAWAGGQEVVSYIFLGLIGVNFLVEFAINLVLSPVTERIITAIRRSMR